VDSANDFDDRPSYSLNVNSVFNFVSDHQVTDGDLICIY